MTIVPKPLEKALRRIEIGSGLLCAMAGAWTLAQGAARVFGSVPSPEIGAVWGWVLVFGKSVYLLGFGGVLLRSGYVSLIFWVIAAAILVSLPVTFGLFA